jgi:hypothetical protein
MADVFYTILIVWVLWKIFGSSGRTYVFNQHNNTAPKKKEGDVSVSHKAESNKSKDGDKGEYIDYEEIK